MARNSRKAKRKRINPGRGTDFVILAGLPRDPLRSVLDTLKKDTSITPTEFTGMPSKANDKSDLYGKAMLDEMRKMLAACVGGTENDWAYTPRRIIVLYVPSVDSAKLIQALGLACYVQPMAPQTNGSYSGGNISWRHELRLVHEVVYDALAKAIRFTNALKNEVTDKRVSSLTLPARNFYFPSDETTLDRSYRDLLQGSMKLEQLTGALLPQRFTRDELPQQAFKGSQQADRFFQDERGRIFPPDQHGYSRYPDQSAGTGSKSWESVMLVLEQRYRFGVVVRDGNQHYDMQYAKPRQLQREPMYCAAEGDVLVTGSHANVGVNDFIWTPDGKKEARPPG